MKKGFAVSRIYTILIFILLYAPIAIMVFFSFNSLESTTAFGHFSLQWYRSLIGDGEVWAAFKNTMLLALLSSLIATAIGTAAAIGLDKMRNRHLREAVRTVTNIPMMNPDIVTGVSLFLLFAMVAVIFGTGVDSILGFSAVLIAHITFNLPYVILSVTPKIRQLDRHLTEAALDLGCTPFSAFCKVELPGIMPGILSGFIMAFTLSIDDFVITYFLSGSEYSTLPVYIYGLTGKGTVTPDVYALSTLLCLGVLVLLILSNVAKKRSQKRHARAV